MQLSHRFVFVACLLWPALAAAAPGKVSFQRDIKPLLTHRCFTCHGPDEAERKADLRLDLRDEALKGAIKPGDAKGSGLYERITSTDPEQVMPPPAGKKPSIKPEEAELIRRWIDEGAQYDAHWAYVPPARPASPAIKNAAWARGEIDRWILAAQEQRGLSPSADADKRTLLRRLSFDLTGLPATPEELDAFVKDTSPQAYEKVVDRLLASEHFGERMALYWLDVVRFADTAGYHSDNHRDLAPYRDYVIRAFNTNKPFDQFTREQLAGDLLPGATNEQRIASGYNRLLQTTEEGGAQAKEYTAKYVADRVRNTSAIWMASTMGCCECHNHKFDPFTAKDFYSLGAFFADVSETAVGRQAQTKVPTPAQEQQAKSLEEQLAATRAKYNVTTSELTAALAKWEQTASESLRESGNTWVAVNPEKAESSGGAKLTQKDDLSLISTGKNPAKDNYTLTITSSLPQITAIRLEALTDDSFPNKSLSRANGNFVLSEFEVEKVAADGKAEKLELSAADADFSQEGFPVANAIDGNAATGWAGNGHQEAKSRMAAFTFAMPVKLAADERLQVKLIHQSQYAQHNIGRLRLSLTSAEKPTLSGSSLPAEVATILLTEADERSPQQKENLFAHFRSIAPELKVERDLVARLEADQKSLNDSFPSTLVSMSTAPRMVRILPRGNWLDDSGEAMQPAVPSFLNKNPTKPEQRQTRLDLANWLLAKDHPLTSRVFVNRVWKLYFGRGLCRSLEDFGMQGEYPTHPELLDWLAADFIDNGWDVKQLIKQMVMSHTYQQTSQVSAELKEKDSTNTYFTRQNRWRIEAELVRDNALAVSGLLMKKIGGASVKPYQPAGYWQYLNFPKREWQNDKGDEQYRRGLYTYWQRTFIHPSLAAFDAPSREECTVQRPVSNTPQQALVLLNDPTYVEAARALAGRIVSSGGGDLTTRLHFAYQQVVLRDPTAAEQKLLESLYEKHLAQYKSDAAAAVQIQTVGDLKPAANQDAAELAAWTSVARVLLNLHETIVRE
ncbi:PSD1 and planctomycete cytochrome C domain-containing protein [Anatilimnocola floriformis]|uniref:PSD1 and planctomycete cytochrome C domain-containing protein n=1 Tax=Anatilimnocola floriformis TaxID=2948575 RepID=UPI0020C1F46D|nr:PSD1 and planctomycete cytochrome C domain-containing protein [Anatilimnocola floriformis]